MDISTQHTSYDRLLSVLTIAYCLARQYTITRSVLCVIGNITTHCECYTNGNGPCEGTEVGFHLSTSVSGVITIPPMLLAHLFVYHKHYTILTFESTGK